MLVLGRYVMLGDDELLVPLIFAETSEVARWSDDLDKRLINIGASPSGKASAFGADIRWFESSRPSQ